MFIQLEFLILFYCPATQSPEFFKSDPPLSGNVIFIIGIYHYVIHVIF